MRLRRALNWVPIVSGGLSLSDRRPTMKVPGAPLQKEKFSFFSRRRKIGRDDTLVSSNQELWTGMTAAPEGMPSLGIMWGQLKAL